MFEKILIFWLYGYFVIAFIMFVIISSGGGIWIGNFIVSILWAMPITLILFFVTIILCGISQLFSDKCD